MKMIIMMIMVLPCSKREEGYACLLLPEPLRDGVHRSMAWEACSMVERERERDRKTERERNKVRSSLEKAKSLLRSHSV